MTYEIEEGPLTGTGDPQKRDKGPEWHRGYNAAEKASKRMSLEAIALEATIKRGSGPFARGWRHFFQKGND